MLQEYREFLHRARGRARTTATTYYREMTELLSDQNIIDCRELDIDKVMNKLEAIEHKNKFSKSKNAFLKFCEFQNIGLSEDTIEKIERMNDTKKKKRRNQKTVALEEINKKINVIRDKKLKLSYKVMLETGLRVSELSQIAKENCIVADDFIKLVFTGKGGKKENVIIPKSKNYVYGNVLELIHLSQEGKKIFYSISHLQAEANKRGFQCHDLRRAFAKLEYKEHKNINKVSKSLRHKNKANTKIYLNSKVDIERMN